MALLTRFISDPDIRPATSNVQADPSAWAAADNASLQSSEHIGDAFHRMMSGFIKASESEEKIDHLYLAQAKADMQVQYNKQLQDLQSKAKPGGAFETDAVTAFDKLSIPYIKNAPNRKTQESLMASFIGTRGNAQIHGQKYQKAINYQDDMNTFTMTSNNLMGLGMKNPTPENIENLKGQITTYAQRMKDKGYGAQEIDKAVNHTFNAFDAAYGNQLAQTNPSEAIDSLDGGKFSHLGPTVESTIRTKAQSQFKAQLSSLKTEHDEIKNRIINDQALPQTIGTTLAKVKGISRHHPEIVEPFKELAGLQQFAEVTRTKTLKEQELERIHLASAAKDNPNISSKAFEDMDKILVTNIKNMKEDPLGYTAKHNLVTLPPIPADINSPQAQSALEQRRFGASVAEQITGQPTLPFVNAEIEQFSQKVQKGTPSEQAEAIKIMQSVDPALAPRVAEEVIKGDANLPLATALQLATKNPTNTEILLKGMEALKSTGTIKEATKLERQPLEADAKALFPGDPKTQAQLINSADAYKAGIGETYLKPEHLESMLNIIKPGTSAWFSGYKTIAPRPDMTASGFEKLTKGLTAKDVETYGNGSLHYSPGQPFNFKRDSLSDYEFKPVDIYSGKYYIMKNNKGLRTADGSLFKIDLGTMVK